MHSIESASSFSLRTLLRNSYRSSYDKNSVTKASTAIGLIRNTEPIFEKFENFRHTLSIAGVSIRITFVKMVSLSTDRGNCA